MLSTAQLKLRKSGLSATDMSKISGENPWGSAVDVWIDKTTPFDPDALPVLASNRAVTGQMLEAAIAKRYVYEAETEGRDLRIVQTATTYQHPVIKWAMATPDRFIFNLPEGSRKSHASLRQMLAAPQGKADWLLECKLVGGRVSRHWNLVEGDTPDCDRIPPYVYVQVQWQAFVLGYERVDVAAVIDGTTFKRFTIVKDDAYINALVGLGGYFWEHNVLGREPPKPDGTDQYTRFLDARYPYPKREIISPPPGSLKLALEYDEYRQAETHAKAEKERRGQVLKQLVGDATGFEGGWGKVIWQACKGQVDWKSLCRDLNISEDTLDKYRTREKRSLKVSVTNTQEDLF